MIHRDHTFFRETDPRLLARIEKSQDVKVLNRFEFFEAWNTKNGNRYKVQIEGSKIICTCHDSQRGNMCKHEIAVRRDLDYFEVIAA